MARLYPDDATRTLAALAAEAIRPPVAFHLDSEAGPVLEFDPPLTPAEQAVLDLLPSVIRSAVRLTPTEYSAVRAQMQILRDLRQLGRNAFMALSAAERDRMLYDAQVATTIVLLALLRD
jgi:hypothetical protein